MAIAPVAVPFAREDFYVKILRFTQNGYEF